MTQVEADALGKVLALSALVSRDLTRFERDSGLTSARIHVMWTLGQQGPSTQHSLARALEVTPRNITGLVDGLTASGHVTREPHPSDRRALLVTPTSRGEALIEDLDSGHRQLATHLFGNVSVDDLDVFNAVLDLTISRFAALMEESS